MTDEILKKIPWKKITAPMIPLIIVDIYLGKFLKDIHSINVSHGLMEKVPTDRTFYIFLVANFIIMGVYLIISALGHLGQEKVNSLRARMELSPAKE